MSTLALGSTAKQCRRAIFATLSTVVLMVLTAAAGVTVLHVREGLLDRQAAFLQNVAAGRAHVLDALDRSWREKAALVAARPGLRAALALEAAVPGSSGGDAVAHGLTDVVRVLPELTAAALLTPEGAVLAATGPGARRIEAGLVAAATANARERPVVLAYRPLADGAARVDLAAPVHHQGALVGFLAVALATDDIRRLAADRSGLGRSGETLVVRRLDGGGGRLLTPPRHAPHRPFAVRAGAPPTPVVHAAQGRPGVFAGSGLLDYRRTRVLAAVAVLDTGRLAVVVKTDRAEVLAPLRRSMLWLAGSVAVAGLGVLTAMRAVATGLTARLADSETRVAAILDHGAGGVVWLDGEKRVRALNPAAERLLQTPAAAAVGSRFDHLDTVVERLGVAMALDELLAEQTVPGRVWRGDLHVARADGGGRDLEAAAAPCWLAEGRFVALMLTDVTERNRHRRQLERALSDEQRAHAQQRDFIATVSHEFRTPLAVIDATARQLLRRPPSREQADLRLQRIRDGVTRLTELMEGVLEAVRSERREPALHVSRLSLSRLVATCAGEARRLDPEHVIVVVAPGPEVWIDGDAAAVRCIIENLLSNARKYAPPNTTITLALTRFDAVVRLFVIDHGRGIPAGERDAVFERFHRCGNVEAVPGTGLGLFIAREHARAHGGDITVGSEEGRGAAFVVTLPAAGPPTGALGGL